MTKTKIDELTMAQAKELNGMVGGSRIFNDTLCTNYEESIVELYINVQGALSIRIHEERNGAVSPEEFMAYARKAHREALVDKHTRRFTEINEEIGAYLEEMLVMAET